MKTIQVIHGQPLTHCLMQRERNIRVLQSLYPTLVPPQHCLVPGSPPVLQTGNLHEASRRLMSVLLREMEGFDAETKRTVVIGATNRKADLDPALLSRFDLIVTFGLPDAACRYGADDLQYTCLLGEKGECVLQNLCRRPRARGAGAVSTFCVLHDEKGVQDRGLLYAVVLKLGAVGCWGNPLARCVC